MLEDSAWMARLAAVSVDRRRTVLAAWIALLIIVLGVGAFVVTGQFTDKLGTSNSESHTAQTLLSARFPAQAGDPADIVFHTTGPIDSPATRVIDRVVRSVRGLPHVT